MQKNNSGQKIGLSETDSRFLAYLRGVSILMIVFMHVGLAWFWKPWSEFLNVFVTIFFFVSGAVLFHSYQRYSSLQPYYIKRLLGLYIPYFLLCLLQLAVYLLQHEGQFPIFDSSKFLAWLEIRPYAVTTPFNIGQVWFLHTLLLISLISPSIFSVIKYRKTRYLIFLILFLLSVSTIQLFYDIDNYFVVFGNNLYKPIIHTLFFTLGAWYFSGQYDCEFKRETYLSFFLGMVLMCILLVHQFDLKIGYSYHTYAPDIYYVLGSLSAIVLIIYLKNFFMYLASLNRIIEYALKALYIYTMPIFLLHSFSIFICEDLLGLVHPDHDFVLYGIVKISLVICITLLLSYPFLKASNFIIYNLNVFFVNRDKYDQA
jgi:peptidoglycan/LPS O-acetylase OafA/YrhL